jgi:hypothetical protein
MMLHAVLVPHCATRMLRLLVVLILGYVDPVAIVLLLSAVIFVKNAYLEHLDTYIFSVLDVMIMSTLSGAVSVE